MQSNVYIKRTTQQLNVSLCTVVILGNFGGKHILHREGPRCECPLGSRKLNAAAIFNLILTFLSMRETRRKSDYGAKARLSSGGRKKPSSGSRSLMRTQQSAR